MSEIQTPLISNEKGMIPFDLKKDHAEIKLQIQGWEKSLGNIVNLISNGDNSEDVDYNSISGELEYISQEMGAINS